MKSQGWLAHTAHLSHTHTHTHTLIWKLKHIGGLRGKLLEWMQDYLKDREMRTVEGGNFKLEESNKWSTAEISPSTHNIKNKCK